MLCQVCKKDEATIHLTEITDGIRVEMHLCQTCASEEGIAAKNQIPLNELLSNLLAVQPADEDLADNSTKLTCDNCGFTLDEFRRDGLLGCPNDYEVFEKALLPLIEKTHNGKTKHCGKVLSKAPADTKKQIALAALQQKLDDAVKSEDYELAAKLRDKIKRLG
ncbi:MAG: UvrB/UvrC motif-containing protein [Planctomycetes bacterium]|nr:UvrB/UvrC motif-containing protein [Planctomycetota bacterium]